MIDAVEAPELIGLPGFAPLDVAANEQGSLSDRQRCLLNRRIAKDSIGTAIAGFVIVLWVVSEKQGMAVFLGGLFVAWMAYKLITFYASIRRGRVCSIEGHAIRECVPDSDGPDDHYLHIGSMKLQITKETYLQMQNGGPYRVFYIEGTQHVVSAAPMPGWREVPAPPSKRRRLWGLEIGL
jgi:hypothetical protein